MKILLLIGVPVYAVVVVLAIFGNTFILAAIIRNKKLHQPVYVFLANQSLSDLLFTLLSFGDAAYTIMETWNMGEIFCKIQGTVMQVLYTISILSLVAVAIERYLEICLLTTVKTTLVTCVQGCLVIALLSFAVCSPMFYSFNAKEAVNAAVSNTSDNSTVIFECTTNNWSTEAELIFNVIHTLVAFLLPLLVLIVTHSKIYAKLNVNQRVRVRQLSSSTEPSKENMNYGSIQEQHDTQSFSQMVQAREKLKAKEAQARKRKVVRMLLVITVLFVLLWAPWFVTRIVKTVLNEHHLVSWKVVQLIAFVSTTTNLFIYVYMNTIFRRTFISFLCCGILRKGNEKTTAGNDNKGFQRDEKSEKNNDDSGVQS